MIYKTKKECTGCSACMYICHKNSIKMEADKHGFEYPTQDLESCVQCNICMNQCPNHINKANDFIQKIYGCKNKNEEIRNRSTSGGVFTAIANCILEKSGVIYGAILDKDFIVRHARINRATELELLNGAKYVQSNLNGIFPKVLEDLQKDRYVLFSGTPCQVAGLKSFLRKDFEKLICVDLVCHGVPSPLLWKKYINYLQKQGKLEEFLFRNKKTGWHTSTTRYSIDGKMYYKNMSENPFTKMYFSGLSIRPSCHECIYTNFNRKGDLTIGDFWGIENVKPQFDDNKGVSLLMVNSLKGVKIFETIKKELEYFETSQRESLQPQLYEPTKKSELHEEFFADLTYFSFEKLMEKYL